MCIGRNEIHNKSQGERRGMQKATQENNNNGGRGVWGWKYLADVLDGPRGLGKHKDDQGSPSG